MTVTRLRVLIADDEPLARLRLQRLLGEMDTVEVVAVCPNARDTIRAIAEHQPDAAFLDVQMPDATGFDVLASVQANRPLVVFVTAHAEHAVSAFDQQAVDYLLKPYSPERLWSAVGRLRERMEVLPAGEGELAQAGGYASRLPVSVGRRIRVIQVEEIDHARAQANYVELHVGDRTYLLRGTISELAQRLDPAQFARVHRSSLVRIAAVDSLESQGGSRYLLHMRNGHMVRSGRSHRDSVRLVFGLA